MPQLAELFSRVLLQLEGQQQPGGADCEPLPPPVRRVLDVPYHALTLLVHPTGYPGRLASSQDYNDWHREGLPDITTCQPDLNMPYLVGGPADPA
jgi:hypothetical protein